MPRVTNFCLRHRRWVLLGWLVLFLAGGASAAGLSDRLSVNFSLPGQPAYDTNHEIARQYGGGGGQVPTLVVVRVPEGSQVDSPPVLAALQRSAALLSLPAGPPGLTTPGRPVQPVRVVSYADHRDAALVGSDGRTTFLLVYNPRPTSFAVKSRGPEIAQALPAQAGFPAGTVARVTGMNELREGSTSTKGSGVLAETLLGAVGALVVLVFVFGSFISVVPMVVAVVSILTTFLLVTVLTTFVEVSFIVQFLVSLIGLGVAIDYSLLIVTRWREERDAGRDNDDAVRVAMATAGHSVLFSGITVAVGLFALVVLPVPFLRSVGYGGVLIPLVSVAVSCTLLPVVLSKCGRFLDRPRIRKSTTASRPWSAWARLVVRRRWTATGIALLILAALIVPALSLRVGSPSSASLASSGPAFEGVSMLRDAGIPTGVLTPIEVLTTPAEADAVIAATSPLAGVRGAVLTGAQGGTSVVDVLPVKETSAPPGNALIGAVTGAVPAGSRVGGDGAESEAFNDAVYGSFPLMLTLIVVVTFLLLVRAFRSILLPFKAVLLNLVSVGATYGVLALVWQQGHGSQAIWGISATGAVTNFVPLMVFAFLFGLSMDYEVFILARMREEYDATGSTPRAVVEGLARTGRLVTSAALILFLSFLALSQAPSTDIKIFATGLGAGILLDATVVRALLVPALISLFGKYNWWLPDNVARLLRVEPSPLREETDLPSAPPLPNREPVPVG